MGGGGRGRGGGREGEGRGVIEDRTATGHSQSYNMTEDEGGLFDVAGYMDC